MRKELLTSSDEARSSGQTLTGPLSFPGRYLKVRYLLIRPSCLEENLCQVWAQLGSRRSVEHLIVGCRVSKQIVGSNARRTNMSWTRRTFGDSLGDHSDRPMFSPTLTPVTQCEV